MVEIFSVGKIASYAEAKGYPNYKLPQEFIASIIRPLKGIKNIIKKEFCGDRIEEVRVSYDDWLRCLSDKAIKETSASVITGEIQLLRDFFRLRCSEEELEKLIQGYQLLVALKFLETSSLEKRLNGVGEIKKAIEQAESFDLLNNKGFLTEEKPRYSSKEALKEWIESNKIIAKIFDENTHAELIKRSLCIFEFLGKLKAINSATLETLWKSQQKKDEYIVKAIHDMINAIVAYLSLENIFSLYEKISATVGERPDELCWEFLKNFTINALKAQYKNQQEEIYGSYELPESILNEPLTVPTSKELYFTNFFWNLSQDKSGLPLISTLKVLSYLKEITRSIEDKKYLFQYLHLCIENVKANISVPQSLDVASSILQLVDSESKESSSKWVKSFNREYDLVGLLISSCQHYENSVCEYVKRTEDTSKLLNAIIVGNLSHGLNLAMRFRLLKNLLKLGTERIPVGEENIAKLCGLYIGSAVPAIDTERFLVWLSWDCDADQTLSLVFNEEESLYLFRIICESHVQLLDAFDLTYYQCFANNFIILNSVLGSIEYKLNKVRVKDFSRISGLDQVWDCVCHSGKEESRTRFGELLLNAHTNFAAEVSVEEREDVMEKFVDKCFEKLAASDSQGTANLLKLLISVLDYVDGRSYESPPNCEQKYPISLFYSTLHYLQCRK